MNRAERIRRTMEMVPDWLALIEAPKSAEQMAAAEAQYDALRQPAPAPDLFTAAPEIAK